MSPLSPWLKFLDETSRIVTVVTVLVCLYTRSAGVIYFATGALACTLSAKIVKMSIRQQRPRAPRGRTTSYGMPSTHASACTFFAVSVLLGSLYLTLHPSFHPFVVFAPLVVVPWACMIVLSRVWLGYHTWPQVAAGVSFGVCFASLWFKVWAEDVGGVGTLGRKMESLVNGLL